MSKLTDHADHLLNTAADLRICLKSGDLNSARLHLSKVMEHHSIITAIIEVVEEINSPKPVNPKGRRTGYKRNGELSRYIRKNLEGLQSGQMRYICPTEQFDIRKLEGSVSSICRADWGKGTYTTQRVWRSDHGCECILVLKG
jgi:hypothetical protein